MSDIIKIGNIPTAITDNHNEVLPYWNIKDAPLFHIDAHHDLWANLILDRGDSIEDYISHVTISNFICPAAHCGIISDMYWLNPHQRGRKKLQHFSLDVIYIAGCLDWKTYNMGEYGLKVKISKVNLDRPYILDIDLDAFSCKKDYLVAPSRYDPEYGYTKRIGQTVNLLSSLPTPKIITITRSNGKNIKLEPGRKSEFVPTHLQDEVERLTINGLRALYE